MSSNPLEMPGGLKPQATPNQPPAMAQLLQQLLLAKQQGGGQPQGGGTPAQIGQAPAAQMPKPVQMAGGAAQPMQTVGQQQPQSPQQLPAPTALPGGTQGGPSSMHSPYNPTPANSQVEFNTKSGKNAATVQNALANLSTTMQQAKQESFQKQVQQTKATMTQYLLLKQQEDPNLQKQADAMIQDPKIQKQLEKAQKDANSPQYYGIQAAYADMMAQAKNKDEQALLQAKTQAELATAKAEGSRGKAEEAHAGLYNKQTQDEGTVTPRVKFTEEEKTKRTAMQVDAEKKRVEQQGQAIHEQTKAHLQAVNAQIAGLLKATQMRTDSAEIISGNKTGPMSKAQQQAQKAMADESTNLNNQVKELDTRTKDLQAHLDKTTHWYADAPDKDQVVGQLHQIDAQREILQKQIQLNEEKKLRFMQAGVLPPEPLPQDIPEAPANIPPGNIISQEEIDAASKSSDK